MARFVEAAARRSLDFGRHAPRPHHPVFLAALVRRFGYERREEPFQLSSGGWSHDYVDGKHAMASGPALRQVSQAVIDSVDFEFDAVGGPTMGADAVAHGVALLSGRAWFSVRKEAKGHGREAWVEGSAAGGR